MRYRSEVSYQIKPQASSELNRLGDKGAGYSVVRIGRKEEGIKGKSYTQLTNSGAHNFSQTAVGAHVEKQASTTSVGGRPDTPVLCPPFLQSTSSATCSNPHSSRSPRLSGHVTNQVRVSTANKATSNYNELDTLAVNRVHVAVHAESSSHFGSDNMEDKFSDTFCDDSSRMSDTDTTSIASSSTVAWDTVADQREMANQQTKKIMNGDKGVGYYGDHDRHSGPITMDMLQHSGAPLVTSGYESTSSLSVNSESLSRSKNRPRETDVADLKVSKIIVSEKAISVLPEMDYPLQMYLNSEDSSVSHSPHEDYDTDHYVIVSSDTIVNSEQSSGDIPSFIFPSNDNNNDTKELSVDDLSTDDQKSDGSLSKTSISANQLAISDILYLQEQGSLLQTVQSQSETVNTDQKNQGTEESNDRAIPKLISEIPFVASRQPPIDTDIKDSLTKLPRKFQDLGSINSRYVPFQSLQEDDKSDCSSLDLSYLDISTDIDSDALWEYDGKTTGKKRLEFGDSFSVFDEEPEAKEADDSVSEWGLTDDTDGLVPLMLPGMISERRQSTMSEDIETEKQELEHEDTFVDSLLKRFVGKPTTPSTSSKSEKSQRKAEIEYDSSSSSSIEISSDTDSGDESYVDLDPSFLSYSTREKDALYKTKLECNKALMRSLLKDIEPKESDPLSCYQKNIASGYNGQPSMSAGFSPMASEEKPELPDTESSGTKTKKRSKRRSKKSHEGDEKQDKPRRKKKSKSDLAEASVGYASKKGLMKHSKTQYGVLSSTTDGKTQLYTFGGEKDNSRVSVDMSKGRYSPLADSAATPERRDTKGSDGPPTPYIGHPLLQPRIYRKQPHTPKESEESRSRNSQDFDSTSSSCTSSSSSCDEDDSGEDEVDRGSANISPLKYQAIRASQVVNHSSDSELSVIMEEPEEGDWDLDTSVTLTERSFELRS